MAVARSPTSGGWPISWRSPTRSAIGSKSSTAPKLPPSHSEPCVARFLHVNPRHHSLAFVQSGKNAVHHVMMELFSFDDVGQGYDLALAEKDRVAVTLGRHTSDFI